MTSLFHEHNLHCCSHNHVFFRNNNYDEAVTKSSFLQKKVNFGNGTQVTPFPSPVHIYYYYTPLHKSLLLTCIYVPNVWGTLYYLLTLGT